MMCVTVSQAVCDSSITFRHDGVKYFENFAIVGINKHLSIMKHTFVTTEPCRSRKLSLSEQTVIINDARSVLADWVSNPQFAGLKRNHCMWIIVFEHSLAWRLAMTWRWCKDNMETQTKILKTCVEFKYITKNITYETYMYFNDDTNMTKKHQTPYKIWY